jgi:hypothetical protein
VSEELEANDIWRDVSRIPVKDSGETVGLRLRESM